MSRKLGYVGFLAITLAVVSPIRSSGGKTYYVRPDGNDGHTGLGETAALAWKTIQHATNTMVAGDTLYLRAGTYPERVILNSGHSGNALDGYITYQNYPGESPVLDAAGAGFTWGAAFNSGFHSSPANAVSYIKFVGLRICNYPQQGIRFERGQAAQDGSTGSHHITIQDCAIHHNGEHGIYIEGGDVRSGYDGHDHLIEGNTVYANADHGIKFQGDAAGTITRLQIRNSTISNNVVYGQTGGVNAGQGIHLSTGNHDNTVSRNKSYGNGTAGISVEESWNNVLENNECYSNGTSGANPYGIVAWHSNNTIIRYNKCHDNLGSGIRLGAELAGAAQRNLVYYNLVYNNGTSAGANSAGISLELTTLAHAIYNNVLYNNHDSGIRVQSNANHEIKNNIIYSVGAGRAADYLIRIETASGWSANRIDHNCYYSTDLTNPWYWAGNRSTFATWKSASGMDVNGKNVNPGFLSSSDYRLQPSSACIDVGSGVGLARDFAGTNVPNGTAVDIGAYEYTTNVLQAPKALRVIALLVPLMRWTAAGRLHPF